MIWGAILVIALLCALFLTRPLLPVKSRAGKLAISGFMASFAGLALGVYALIGTPNFEASSQPEIEAVEIGPKQIQAMVDGLAARLKDSPDDPAGWTRLIRSRLVLGDVKGAIADHQSMREVFKDQPEVIAKISTQSGFDAMAQQALQSQDE